jgi:glycosyltransferase involved in cell wall biosynthesis
VHFAGPAHTRYLYSPHFHRWIRRHAPRFDAVVIHGLWRYTSVGVWRGLRSLDVPYFVFPHGMLDPYFRRAFPAKHLQKAACWLAAERRVVRDARAVLFTCEEERRRAQRTFRPYACRERVIGLGIARPQGDLTAEKEEFLASFPQLAGKRLALFLARIHPKKGCDLLIRAFARVAGADPLLHLVMAGPDECGWRSELERLAAQLAVRGRIVWTGPLYGSLKRGALSAADVLALPSYTENFGISVVEAMACGVPVLISDQVNIWREIESDGAGLAAPANVDGMTALFERWLETPAAARLRMRINAIRSFSRRFELERFGRDFLQCLRTA